MLGLFNCVTVDRSLKNAVRGICYASASHVWKDLDVRMRYSAVLLRFTRKSLCCVGGKVGRSRLGRFCWEPSGSCCV